MIERIRQRVGRAYTLEAICKMFGITRQAHYQALQREEKRLAQEAMVIAAVQRIRRDHPRMGGRKVWRRLQVEGILAAVSMGRDRLLALMRAHDLLVPRAPRRPRTTQRGLWHVPHRLVNCKIERPLQVVVSDISYWRLRDGGFVYLYVVMDLFSRVLVGWHVGRTLQSEEALWALQKAWRQFGPFPPAWIHHSDQGWQYGSHLYRTFVETHGGLLSMGRTGWAYDNAYAERVIGTLKREYLLHLPAVSLAQARMQMEEAVRLYNTQRPHEALNYAIPMEVFQAPDRFTHLAFRLCEDGDVVRRCA